MKILHLHTNLNLTCGITRTIYLVSKNISEDANHSVLALGGDAIDKFKKAGLAVHILNLQNRGALSTAKIFFHTLKIVKSESFNVIHSHHRYFDFIAFLISKIISIKTITSVQSKVYQKKSLSYKSQMLIACSNSIKNHLVNYFKIDQNKIKVIHNFVNETDAKVKIGRDEIKSELNIEEKLLVVGFVGRFSLKEKGVDILLEAFGRASQTNKNTKLIFIGEGEDKKYILDFIFLHKINAAVISPKENIFDYYNIIDIVVMPSRIEPFGIVAVEAGLMKKAVIASNADGLSEIIDNGINGILFPSESIESLTESLILLINNYELRKKLGDRLHEKVKKYFSAEVSLPKYSQAYLELIGQKGN